MKTMLLILIFAFSCTAMENPSGQEFAYDLDFEFPETVYCSIPLNAAITAMPPAETYKKRRQDMRAKLRTLVDERISKKIPLTEVAHWEYDNNTPLTLAAQSDKAIGITQLLLKAGINPNIPDERGYIYLCRASYNCALNTAKTLLAYGAKPNITEEITLAGNSPLLAACSYTADSTKPKRIERRLGIVNTLLEAGADPNLKNHYGETPLFPLVMGYQGFFDEDDLSPEDHKLFLDQRKELITILIKAGVQVDAKNNNGQTAVEYGMGRGNADLAEFVKSIGITHD